MAPFRSTYRRTLATGCGSTETIHIASRKRLPLRTTANLIEHITVAIFSNDAVEGEQSTLRERRSSRYHVGLFLRINVTCADLGSGGAASAADTTSACTSHTPEEGVVPRRPVLLQPRVSCREKRFLGAGKPPCAADFPTAAGGSVPIVTRFGRLSGHRAGPQQNNLVRMKQTRQLNWRRLLPSRKPRDQDRLRDIVGNGDADAAQRLDTLGELIDKLAFDACFSS